jgi:hypothetical protein
MNCEILCIYPNVLIGDVQVLSRIKYYEITDRFVLPM